MTNKAARKNLLIISLHADPSMPPGVGEWGGTHTYMRELLTELCATNYNVTLITRKVYQNEKDIEDISPSCRILRLTLGDFGIFDKRELYKLHDETAKQVIEKLKASDFKPHIIHSVYWNSGHLAMKLSKLWNVPYVHSVISNGRGRNEHGASGTAPYRIQTEELVFLNASFILCVAESEKEELCKYYNIFPNKIVVAGQYVHPSFLYAAHDSYGNPRKSGISYKIEPIYFSDYRISHSTNSNWWNKHAFTYTGRLSLDKGLHYIVQAWLLLLKKHGDSCPPLWIIGGNAEDINLIRPQLGIAIEELNRLEKRGRLLWWGFLDENGISAVYSRTLALITHSKYEPGGRVAVEAMCESLPVLATPNGFALDTITDWLNGFLITYGDIYTLALRMEHFIKQPFLSDCMGYCAKKTGRAVVDDWAFIETHLSVYHAALEHKQEYSKQNNFLPQSDCQNRKLHTYPYNMILLDAADILQIMENNNILDVLTIHQLEVPNASSFLWEVTTKHKEYYVKIPYDRMNLFPLWADAEEHPSVTTSRQRYHAEIGALKFSEIPQIAGKDDLHCAIIREKYEHIEISKKQQLTFAINKINMFYKKNMINLQDSMHQLNAIIETETDYKKVDAFYITVFRSIFPWQNYYMDYSLRIELKRWHHYYNILTKQQQKSILDLFQTAYKTALSLAVGETKLSPVICHGGCDYKNLIFVPEVVLLDNEKLHIGWPGIDYADFLLTYVQNNYENETTELWRDILSIVPQNSIPREILIGWLLLGVCKSAVSEAARLNQISSALYCRTNIFLQLLT